MIIDNRIGERRAVSFYVNEKFFLVVKRVSEIEDSLVERGSPDQLQGRS